MGLGFGEFWDGVVWVWVRGVLGGFAGGKLGVGMGMGMGMGMEGRGNLRG